MTRFYTTPHQAAADALAIDIPRYRNTIYPALLGHIDTVVRNPGTNSDMLLITADALRAAADAMRFHPTTDTTPQYRQLAATLTDLAPTRATPIEDAA